MQKLTFEISNLLNRFGSFDDETVIRETRNFFMISENDLDSLRFDINRNENQVTITITQL